ncbi:hypothetical protein [Streptosporangium fragile]
MRRLTRHAALTAPDLRGVLAVVTTSCRLLAPGDAGQGPGSPP